MSAQEIGFEGSIEKPQDQAVHQTKNQNAMLVR